MTNINFRCADSFWLINSNRIELKRFIKNSKSEHSFFEYMFVDNGEIISILCDKPPLMRKKISVKFEETIEIFTRLLSQ